MTILDIKNLWVAKEKFDYVGNVKNKVPYDKWVEFIQANQDYFTWLEDTIEGKETLSNITSIPESFRDSILRSLNKCKACTEYNKKRNFMKSLLTTI